MGKLLRNLLIMEKREINFFESEVQEYDLVKSIKAVCIFVNELVANGLIWNNEKKTRHFLMTSLDFYETVSKVLSWLI